MRQERKKERDKAAISLVLCFSVIAIASVFTVKSSIDKLNLQKRTSDLGNTPKIEQPVTQPIPTVDSKDNEDVKEQSESKFDAPLSGKIITEFSADAPVYSKTLDQYMTHYGIDIAAPLDTQVKAIADGTVTKVYTDDKYGITIEIKPRRRAHEHIQQPFHGQHDRSQRCRDKGSGNKRGRRHIAF